MFQAFVHVILIIFRTSAQFILDSFPSTKANSLSHFHFIL